MSAWRWFAMGLVVGLAPFLFLVLHLHFERLTRRLAATSRPMPRHCDESWPCSTASSRMHDHSAMPHVNGSTGTTWCPACPRPGVREIAAVHGRPAPSPLPSTDRSTP